MSLLLAACLLAATGSAQVQPSGWGGTIAVRLVEVEVVATDGDGNPIAGLRREDFELLDDGRPVTISNFAAPAPAADGQAPPAGTSAGSGRPVTLVVLADTFGLQPRARNDALAQLRDLLPEFARRGVRVLLAVQDGALRIVHRAGDDPALLPERLDAVAASPMAGAAVFAERNALLAELSRIDQGNTMTPGTFDPNRSYQDGEARNVLPRILDHMHDSRRVVRGRIAAFSHLVGMLSGLPGRTALLYIGDTIDPRPGEAVLQTWMARFPAVAQREDMWSREFGAEAEVASDLGGLAAAAAEAGVAVYVIASGSAIDLAPAAAEVGGTRAGSVAAMHRPKEKLDALFQVTETSGGRTLRLGRSADSGMASLPLELAGSYSLGFVPDRPPDDQPHRIEVRLGRPDSRLRHRETYVLQRAPEGLSELALNALLFGAEVNPLGSAVVKQSERARDGESFDVELVVTVPLASVGLEPAEGAHRGRVSISYIVEDPLGRTTEPRAQTFPVQIPNRALYTALGQQASFTFKIVVRPGLHRFAVAIRDELSETSSSTSLAFRVGPETG
jgi:VWFA-related protein